MAILSKIVRNVFIKSQNIKKTAIVSVTPLTPGSQSKKYFCLAN